MADWTVRIAVDDKGNTVFQPLLQSAGPLQMAPGDTAVWSNATPQEHQPTLTTFNGAPVTPGGRGSPLYLSDPIIPDETSRPTWVAPATLGTYTYVCAFHKDESATIVVANAPTG